MSLYVSYAPRLQSTDRGSRGKSSGSTAPAGACGHRDTDRDVRRSDLPPGDPYHGQLLGCRGGRPGRLLDRGPKDRHVQRRCGLRLLALSNHRKLRVHETSRPACAASRKLVRRSFGDGRRGSPVRSRLVREGRGSGASSRAEKGVDGRPRHPAGRPPSDRGVTRRRGPVAGGGQPDHGAEYPCREDSNAPCAAGATQVARRVLLGSADVTPGFTRSVFVLAAPPTVERVEAGGATVRTGKGPSGLTSLVPRHPPDASSLTAEGRRRGSRGAIQRVSRSELFRG